MQNINQEDLVKSLQYLLKETFEGSPAGSSSIYLDRGVGFFSTLDELNAEQASFSITEMTVAAHSEHARYYLEVLNNFLGGMVQTADWDRSWAKKEVDDKEWEELKSNFRVMYKTVGETFQKIEDWNDDKITEAMAIIVHSAYHLGAIRQIKKCQISAFKTGKATIIA